MTNGIIQHITVEESTSIQRVDRRLTMRLVICFHAVCAVFTVVLDFIFTKDILRGLAGGSGVGVGSESGFKTWRMRLILTHTLDTCNFNLPKCMYMATHVMQRVSLCIHKKKHMLHNSNMLLATC